MSRWPVVCLVVASLAAAACAPAPSGGRGGTAEDPWVVGMSQSNLGEPWRVQMDADVRAAAAAQGNLRVIFKDAQNDSLAQRAQIEEFVEQRVDLIVISPNEAAPLTRPVAAAVRSGIPVIVLDREVQGDEYTAFIGADNVLIGRAAGRWLRERLGGQGRIVELKGLMTSTPGRDRNRGFLEGIAGARACRPRRSCSAARCSGSSRTRAARWSRRSPTNAVIDAVYAHNDPGAHGAWLAARAAGREQEMVFVGIDALPHEGQQYVRQGILDASFLYPTGGAEAIDMALAILRGETVAQALGARHTPLHPRQHRARAARRSATTARRVAAMSQRVALFWPGDGRDVPNELALPSVVEATRQMEAALRKLGREPYRVDGFITKPHEAIEKLGRVDDPMIGMCVHWFYGPHTTDGVVGKDNPLLLASNFSGQWPGLVGLLNTGACLESLGRPLLADLDRRRRLDGRRGLHGAARRVVHERDASPTTRASWPTRRRCPPAASGRAHAVARRVARPPRPDPDARRHVDGHDQRLLRAAAAATGTASASTRSTRPGSSIAGRGIDERRIDAGARLREGTRRHLPLGRSLASRTSPSRPRASSCATTCACSTWWTSTRPTASAGSISSGCSGCGRRPTSPKGCSTRRAGPSRRATRSSAAPRPTRATSSRWR